MGNCLKSLISTILFLCLPTLVGASNDYVGEKQCYSCHRNIKKVYLSDIHGKVFTNYPRTVLGEKGCEACHGPGREHKIIADDIDYKGSMKIEAFKKDVGSWAEKNKICLRCHERGQRTHWQGSLHEMSELSCLDCHTIHSSDKRGGTEVCLTCHRQKRAQLQRSSHMPLREGKMTCVSCHNPHGTLHPAMLKKASINENCYSCHAEKRGPLLWEHAPVRENCASCHDPHGSNNPSLLTMKVPYLCQNCHMPFLAHPRDLYDRGDLSASQPASPFFAGKACLNCHSLVHGSNHPSGARFTR